MPQQLCHYVGGNYESDENGEGERIGATKKRRREKNAPTLKRERKLSITVGSTSLEGAGGWGGVQGRQEVRVMRSDEGWWSVEDTPDMWGLG